MALDLKNIKSMVGLSGITIKAATTNAGEVVWKAGAIVTYIVDTGEPYTEEVDSGTSCLSPTKFTPSKNGWTFIGWSEDTVASENVLSSKTMGSEPITLYAVFKQDVTCTFVSRNANENVIGTRFYNGSGKVVNASVTCPDGTAYSGWTWRGWSANGQTEADSTVAYVSGDVIDNLSSGGMYYGLYQADVVLTTVVNGKSTEYKDTKYHCSAGFNKNPQFTVANPTVDGYTFIGWATSSGATVATYETINDMTISSSRTLYALFATHYYVKFTDYPIQEVSTDGNADYSIRTNAADYYIDVLRNPDSGYGIVIAKTVLPTNNCNKVRIKYTAYNGTDRQICGTYVDAVSSYITFDCSGDTFELTMRVVNSDSGNWATMTISEVYFYYEK